MPLALLLREAPCGQAKCSPSLNYSPHPLLTPPLPPLGSAPSPSDFTIHTQVSTYFSLTWFLCQHFSSLTYSLGCSVHSILTANPALSRPGPCRCLSPYLPLPAPSLTGETETIEKRAQVAPNSILPCLLLKVLSLALTKARLLRVLSSSGGTSLVFT